MKRFLINLIATTLLLIVTLSSFGCKWPTPSEEEVAKENYERLKVLNDEFSLIEPDVNMYKIVKTDSNLPQKIEQGQTVSVGTYSIRYDIEEIDFNSDGPDLRIYFKNVDDVDDEVIELNKSTIYNLYNAKYKKINNILYSYNKDACFQKLSALLMFDENIFIYCMAYGTKGFWYTGVLKYNFDCVFATAYLFDLETKSMHYVGYAPIENMDELYHQNYMIVKE